MFGKLMSGRSQRAQSSTRGNSINDSMTVNVAPDEQLQNRIIAYFANGQKMELIPAGPVEVTPTQKQSVVHDLQSGKISQRELEYFLSQILSPIQDPDANLPGIFQRISSNMREKQIMAVAAGYNASNWQNFSRDDLRKWLSKTSAGGINYQTPAGFASFRIQFLDGIKDQASKEQFSEYIQTMDQLERDLYGQRFNYYQQIQLLARPDKPSTNPDELAFQAIIAEENQQAATAAPTPQPAAVPTTPVTGAISTITPEQSNNILSQAVIDGDPWMQDGNEYRLSTANLISGGLMPACETTLDNRTIAFSVPFQLSDGRGAVLGYALDNGSAKVRSYYLNPKTGLWHYAPEIIRGARGEGIGQIGEGYSLESTMLPLAIQQQLSELVKSMGFREITNVNADFLFAGTAMAYNTKQEYRDALATGNTRGDFYREVDREPINRSWQPRNNAKNVPQLISINTNLAPDFQKRLGQFMTYSILAGQVAANYFLARDGQEIWLFCNDELGRTWIGNIEVISPVTSTGCRRDWLQAGDMTTPLYEHSTKANNYGDPNDTRKGLVGMWNQYLSKIPLIQEYVGMRR